ncbi:uncharacterized protein BXZ73DRAFT_98565 [Epithele typhae]|uniref:uncharacterized protein n=1 Tax=Epithele typhae TaxID=378194 RepID=UPI002007BAD9|nr:uncharacterized protein BXZ73DRAFT_98565 [Epithele typhae]KAH9940735.1 hypothetical protein BXZ73DRAFT_98565 [Epithele typhae]
MTIRDAVDFLPVRAIHREMTLEVLVNPSTRFKSLGDHTTVIAPLGGRRAVERSTNDRMGVIGSKMLEAVFLAALVQRHPCISKDEMEFKFHHLGELVEWWVEMYQLRGAQAEKGVHDPAECRSLMDQLVGRLYVERGLKVPVCTPCGHLCCEGCLTAYIEASDNAMSASCPTCRANFTIAIPDLHFVPKKYHSFMIPSVRRIFIPIDVEEEPSATVVDTEARHSLRAQVVGLSEKVDGLERDRALLVDRCESAQRAAQAHAQGEREMRLEKERLEREMRELRMKYEGLKGKYKMLKAPISQDKAPARAPPLQPAPGARPTHKRTSTQASLDGARSAHPLAALAHATVSSGPDSQDDSDSAHLARVVRPQSRISKRPRLLGSPFDLQKRMEARRRARAHRGVSDDELDADADVSFGSSSVLSSVGPQRSGLPTGDIFSPSHRGGRGGGRASMSCPWLMTPEDD